MDITEQWGKIIDRSLARFAKDESRDDKQDCKQECFVELLKYKDRIEEVGLQGERAADNYVHRVCSNFIPQYFMDLRNHTESHESLDDNKFKDKEYRPAQTLFGIEQADLDESIKNLSVVEQYVIRHIFFLGHTEKEIAKQLGKPQQRVSDIKLKALETLRYSLCR